MAFQDEIILYRLEKEVFLSLICHCQQNSFEYYHNLSIIKFKSMQKIKEATIERQQENELYLYTKMKERLAD